MEENQISTEQTTKTTVETNSNDKNEVCNCTMNPILKTLLLALLIFAGAFCAAYVVIDWHAKHLFSPFYNPMPEMEKSIQSDMKMMNKMLKSEGFKPSKNGNIIHMDKSDDGYKIIIDLRPFENNENNLTVSTEGDVLTISGRSIKKDKNSEHISRFQQSYMFGQDVRLEELQKKTQGHYLVISIPIEEKEE